MRKNIITLISCLLLVAFVLTGCSGTKTDDTTGSSEATSQVAESSDNSSSETSQPDADSSEDRAMIDDNIYATGLPIAEETIDLDVVMVQQPAHGDFEEMQFFIDLEEATNIHINWTIWPSSSATEQRQLLLATGELPDIFLGQNALKDSDITTYAAEGVFLPLDDLIAEYAPNVAAAFEQNINFKNACTNVEDGKVYSIGRGAERIPKTNADCLFIYQPWLDKLGLEVPTTTEEFADVLTAFKNDDPNGNGKADEVPFSFTMGNRQNDLHSMFGSFGRVDFINNPAGHFVCDEDGTLVFTANKDEYKNAIIWFNQMFAEGLFDKEGLTSSDTKAIVALGNSEEVILGSFVGYDAANYVPQDRISDYAALKPLIGPDGDQIWSLSGYENGNITGRGFTITNTNEYPEASVRWIDQFFDKDNSVIIFLGPEGVCIEKDENGMWTYIETPADMSYSEFRFGNTPVHVPCAIFLDEWDSVVQTMDEDVYKLEILENCYKEYQTNNIPYIKYNQKETDYLNSTGADINEYVDNRLYTWLLNGGIEEEWDSYCAKLEQLGINEYYDVVNTAYERMN